ncbi:C40 family peptidase [Brachybacterium huguangmaarense]
MAQSNTHRAAGRAVTPINSTVALKGAGAAAVLGSVAVGAFGSAQAAPANPAPAAPQAAVVAQAPAVALPALPVAPVATPTIKVSTGAVLYRGTANDRVQELQTALNDNGADLKVDGIFGRATHNAVIDFQSSNGLKVDGRVGPQTRSALNGGPSVASGTSKSSSSSDDDDSSSSSSASGSSIVAIARSQKGVDYRSRAKQPGEAFDCSGLTQWVYQKAGISIPRTSSAQASAGTRISKSEARPGDLVVWPGHVGIYAGGNTVIDAGNSKGSVSERTIWGSPSFRTFR